MRIRPSVAHIHIYNGVAPVQGQYECRLRVVGQRAFGAEDALLCPRPLNAWGCMVEVVVARNSLVEVIGVDSGDGVVLFALRV